MSSHRVLFVFHHQIIDGKKALCKEFSEYKLINHMKISQICLLINWEELKRVRRKRMLSFTPQRCIEPNRSIAMQKNNQTQGVHLGTWGGETTRSPNNQCLEIIPLLTSLTALYCWARTCLSSYLPDIRFCPYDCNNVSTPLFHLLPFHLH